MSGPDFVTEAGKWSNDNPPMHDGGGLYANNVERDAKPIRLVERLEFDVASVDPEARDTQPNGAFRPVSTQRYVANVPSGVGPAIGGGASWGLAALSASTDRGLPGRAAMSR